MSVTSFVDSVGLRSALCAARLPRRPGLHVRRVLTLALGIGATTAIFSVVYSVLIKPLPYPNSDELVRIRHSAAAINTNDLSAASTMYLTYRKENRTFAEIGVWSDGGGDADHCGEPERVRSLRVTYGTLQALGVQPMRGRWFTRAGARTRGGRARSRHSLVMRSGRGGSAATQRCSGASSSIEFGASFASRGWRHHAGRASDSWT